MKIFHYIFLIFILLLSFNAKAQEPEIISARSFLAKNPSLERKNIVDFIIHQFDNNREAGVTQEQLDNLWNNPEARKDFFISRFQIINNKLYTDSIDIHFPYYTGLLQYLQKLLKLYKIQDVDFIFHMKDGIFADQKLKETFLETPSFLMSKDIDSFYEKDRFLLPDLFLMEDYWNTLIKKIEEANYNYSWDSKIDKLFWRGFTTGNGEIEYSVNNFDKFPRLSLVILSKLYPDLIDAKFNRFSFDENKSGEDLKTILYTLSKHGPKNKYEEIGTISEEGHLKYKYLISIDGNTCAWRRVPWIMLSNSVLVKQETSKIEWFYPAIKPYVHYIPVNERITDIFPKLKWMEEHDKELHLISQNAQDFVRNNLMPEDIEAQTVIILNEYHKLHKDNKIIATLPPVEEIFVKIESFKKQETEKNMSNSKKIKRFFRELKEIVSNLWS